MSGRPAPLHVVPEALTGSDVHLTCNDPAPLASAEHGAKTSRDEQTDGAGERLSIYISESRSADSSRTFHGCAHSLAKGSQI